MTSPTQITELSAPAPASPSDVASSNASSRPTSGTPRVMCAAEMERAEKLRVLGEMASGVVHDINNMLGAILGRAQLVRMKADVGEIKRHVEHIEMIASKAGETVKRLLEFTRQGHRTGLQTVDLNLVVAEAIEVTRHRWETQAQERGIVYTVDSKLVENVTISGIQSELVDAIANMILNALDAMPTGGPLTLSTQRRDTHCRLIVADEGVGMTKDQIDHAFSPFYTTKGDSGTGLGLAVVYGIVTRHNGEITVESTPGRGSRFTIVIPFADETTGTPGNLAGAAASDKRRVLLVDDDSTILDVLSEALRDVGHDVKVCDSGAAAIVALAENDHDVVITDLGMPGVNGWDVARRAQQLEPTLPVIVISGWGAQITQEQLDEVGVKMILAKPFRLEQIRQAIAGIPQRAVAR